MMFLFTTLRSVRRWLRLQDLKLIREDRLKTEAERLIDRLP